MTNISLSNLPQSMRPGMPVPSRAGAPARADQSTTPQTELQAGPAPGAQRPVRISRYPEEAALFAYNRQAELNARKAPSTIDEYV